MARVAGHNRGGALPELERKGDGRAAVRWLRAGGWGLARMGSILALALAWELLARSGAFTPYMLPALSAVLERIWSDLISGDLLLNTAVTLYRALAGFLIGAVAGIALGMAITRSTVAHWFFDPVVSVGFPMPKIAFLPVVMLWLGVYDLSKITMVSVEAVFPVVTATIIGIRGVERELIWSARNMGAGERELLWQIAFPEHRLALCRFARRFRRHRRDCRDRLRAGQADGARAPALAALAPGGSGAKHGLNSALVFRSPTRLPNRDRLASRGTQDDH